MQGDSGRCRQLCSDVPGRWMPFIRGGEGSEKNIGSSRGNRSGVVRGRSRVPDGQESPGDRGRGVHRQSPGRASGRAMAIESGRSCDITAATTADTSRPCPPKSRRSSRSERGDLKDPAAVRRAVDGQEWVLHLGALIAIPYSYQNPYDVVQTNVMGTAHVLDACRSSAELERVVLTSTSEVYGTAQQVPIDEDHPLRGQSPYAATKIAADAMGESYHRAFGLPVTILRPFNTFGPRQSARAIIPTIISQALTRPVVKLGRLDPRRDLTYVKDTVAGFVAIAGCDAAIGRRGQHRPGRGRLDRRAGRDDRAATGPGHPGRERRAADPPGRQRGRTTAGRDGAGSKSLGLAAPLHARAGHR